MKIRNYDEALYYGLDGEFDQYHTAYIDKHNDDGKDLRTLDYEANQYAAQMSNQLLQERISTQVIEIMQANNQSLFTTFFEQPELFRSLSYDTLKIIMKEYAYAMEGTEEKMNDNQFETFQENIIEQIDL